MITDGVNCKRIVASVGAQLVPVQLPVIAPSLDVPVIPPPPSPEIAVDPVPVVDDEPVVDVPILGVTPEDPEGETSTRNVSFHVRLNFFC